MELDEYELGARIKRVFTAFLVSNFVTFVQVWLGMEYNKLAKDLDAFSSQQGSNAGDLARASALFRKASRLTFFLFALGISMYVIDYGAVYGLEMSIFRLEASLGGSPYGALSTYLSILLDVVIVVFLFTIAISIFSIVNNITLRNAWTLVLSYFQANESGASWLPAATKQVERVIKGTRKSIISSGVSMIEGILVIILFSTLFSFFTTSIESYNYMYVNMMGYAYAWAIMGIATVILAVIGVVFGLQGTINQGIGLFDLAKALQGNGALAGAKAVHGGQHGGQLSPPRMSDRHDREVPMPTPTPAGDFQIRFCRACGLRVLPEWKALYCPSCGARLF